MMDPTRVAHELTKQRPTWQDDTVEIASARIEHTSLQSHVWGSDGEEERVIFSYYCDELVFNPAEFVGNTVGWARGLHRKRDIYYLQH